MISKMLLDGGSVGLTKELTSQDVFSLLECMV